MSPATVEVTFWRGFIQTRRYPADRWLPLLRKDLRLRPGANVMPEVLEIVELEEGWL